VINFDDLKDVVQSSVLLMELERMKFRMSGEPLTEEYVKQALHNTTAMIAKQLETQGYKISQPAKGALQ
jgi:hypothetical protein